MTQTFYSNGKLLITGEYVVLNGAKAFALPTKFGQKLIVDESDGALIGWTSFDYDGSIWFEDSISFSSITKKERFDDGNPMKNTLIEILHEAYLMNPDFITNAKGYSIKTELTFPKFWGLGTSSTLINNIAQWIEVDAFELLKRSFGGSGYDIACAQNNTAILYQLVDEKPTIEIVDFNPDFADKIFFVYLNKKQSSKSAIVSYFNYIGDVQKTIPTINKITKTIVETSQLKEFALALQEHEIVLSSILKLLTVKESLFEDFDGVIKSLGAWGGDFVMAVAKENPTVYFKEKGFEVVIPYHEMIL
ncbi:GYDIA family GHMP kinase [Flavobacterium sp. RSB2_4_14]|uniref:GYDIA family GHMP kinase n=1 Tax=Flavobacterium sp. RSB2_4_14 TaxID=3447665 RepID=UPI003F34CF5D